MSKCDWRYVAFSPFLPIFEVERLNFSLCNYARFLRAWTWFPCMTTINCSRGYKRRSSKMESCMSNTNDLSFLPTWMPRAAALVISCLLPIHSRRTPDNGAETELPSRAVGKKPYEPTLIMRWTPVACTSEDRIRHMQRIDALPALQCSWRLSESEASDRNAMARAS